MKRRKFVQALAGTAFVGAMGGAEGANSFRSAGRVGGISPLETRVLGQRRWVRGGPASLRVIVTNHLTRRAIPARIRLALRNSDKTAPMTEHELFRGRTDEVGSVDASFHAPAAPAGSYTLLVQVETDLGNDEVAQEIDLEPSTRLMLTTDKPIYQPGQVIHLRALALDRGLRTPVAGVPITFEVEDARGNKVYKQRLDLSDEGIAGADFQLADEVNKGVFTVRALLPDTMEERKVRVEQYVLPKFKTRIQTDKPYYLPGETLRGTIETLYFFGKPAQTSVTVVFNTLDVGVSKIGEVSGQSDENGLFQFTQILPPSFVGQPFEQGKGVLELQVTARDTADHEQEANLSIPVVPSPLSVQFTPERTPVVPRVSNRLYISVATPDDHPAAGAKVEILPMNPDGPEAATLTTDALGLAVFEYTPGGAPASFRVRVQSREGMHWEARYEQETADRSSGAVLLRPDRSLALVGDRVNLNALTPNREGSVYLDVVRDGQTILTRAKPNGGGETSFDLPITEDMVGTLELHAYRILPNEDIVRDSRILVVSPARELEIEWLADAPEYRPGSEAALRLRVTDSSGRRVAAALGLAFVDESVFALSEMRPGLEKVYFTLERELMDPKWEIHGLTPESILLDRSRPDGPVSRNPAAPRELEPARQRAAAMLFAGVPAKTSFDFHVNTFEQRWKKLRSEVVTEMAAAARKIQNAAQRYATSRGKSLQDVTSVDEIVRSGALQKADLNDRWGRPYRLTLRDGKTFAYGLSLSSAGPDGRWDTNDDIERISAYGEERTFNFSFGDVVRLRAMEVAPRAGTALAGATSVVNAAGAMVLEKSASRDASATGQGNATPRVRSYFPETLYWNPGILTDSRGEAQLTIPVADSITAWRGTVLASSARGLLGSGSVALKVFQPFFVDLDLPAALTMHDRVELPVAVYNYSAIPQSVTLTLDPADWFSLDGPAQQVVQVDAGAVKSVKYPLTAQQIGSHSLTVHATGAGVADAIRRDVEVAPDGKLVEMVFNDSLSGAVERTVEIPPYAVPGGSSILVRFYPGSFSQVVDGLEGMLRMPYGCFEQTSSTTYPNVLILSYLEATKKANPEIQMKAEALINTGYQRLVTFEVKTGGFSWFGDAPAHQVLTAYGLLEFSDMAKVHSVDPALIHRTQEWLIGKQRDDGSWLEENQGIDEGIINRQKGAVRTTAYVAWALMESGSSGPHIDRAMKYLEAHRAEIKDPYALAVLLNLSGLMDPEAALTWDVEHSLKGMAVEDEKTAYWKGSAPTFTGAEGGAADIETTGLAAFALAKWGKDSTFLKKVLSYLVKQRSSNGLWGTTQGTVWTMKALLYASSHAVGSQGGRATVSLNGAEKANLTITPDQSDVMRQMSLGKLISPGVHRVGMEYRGDGSLGGQVVARYYVPWEQVQPAMERPVLSLSVEYDRTHLGQNDTAGVTVKVRNNTNRTAKMPLIDLGVPPGFIVETHALDVEIQKKRISKYTVAARQLVIYLEKLGPGEEQTLNYSIKARFPIKAQTPPSKVYPYYNPERVSVAAPAMLEVV